MIIRCDNCSVSLQLDESKIPGGNFTVRCPRCQNMLRCKQGHERQRHLHRRQLADNKPAPAEPQGAGAFAEKQSEFEINSALRSLLDGIAKRKDVARLCRRTRDEKPRRVLLCLGDKKDEVAKMY